MKTVSQFYTTRNLFQEACGCNDSLSYDDWMTLPDDYKAAALYIVFFDQVTLAWVRLRTPAAVEEDCVSEVLVYLQKNVDKIKDSPERFTPAYIYRVCYNCIYCKSVDPYSGQTASTSWYNNTCSNIMNGPEDSFDLFDLTESRDSTGYLESEVEHTTEAAWFWEKVKAIPNGMEVAEELLGGKKNPKIGKQARTLALSQIRDLMVQYA